MPTVNALNWMSAIDQATSIRNMSIPGTHESAARYEGEGFSKCQNLNLTQQLERGIRFLDIRCKYVSSDGKVFFPVHHAGNYQRINLVEYAAGGDGASVEAQCIDFLNKHPSETILLNLQQEVTDDGPPFGAKFMEVINRDYWHLGTAIPSLGDVRRRIVLIRANDPASPDGGWSLPSGQPIGLQWTGFKHNGRTNTAPFETQNKWEGTNGTEKGQLVEQFLDWAAAGQEYPDWIYLNFLSYATAHIGDSASDMNNRILNYIKTQPKFADKSKRLGVLPMDFCGNTGMTGHGCLEDEIILHNRFIAGWSYAP
jgi:1-phosphatidylinositol phosphodiesterase